MKVCEGEIFGIFLLFYRDADVCLSGEVVDGNAAAGATTDSELSRFHITFD